MGPSFGTHCIGMLNFRLRVMNVEWATFTLLLLDRDQLTEIVHRRELAICASS